MGLLPDTQTSTQVWATVFFEHAPPHGTRPPLFSGAVYSGIHPRRQTRQTKTLLPGACRLRLVCGPDEVAAGTVVLKNLSTGDRSCLIK